MWRYESSAGESGMVFAMIVELEVPRRGYIGRFQSTISLVICEKNFECIVILCGVAVCECEAVVVVRFNDYGSS